MDANFISLIQDRFFYENGKLYYRINVGKRFKAGSRAGCTSVSRTNMPYRAVVVNGKNFCEAKIIWMMHYGIIPQGYRVCHKNGDSLCNLLDNLTLENIPPVSRAVHPRTSRSLSKARGVLWRESSKKWEVAITKEHKRYYIGLYPSIKQAATAYNKAAKALLGDRAVLNDISLINEWT